MVNQFITTPRDGPKIGPVTRPRVIFADDSAQLLDHTVRLMADACDIVATASDGAGVVELVERLLPDIAVLDITMPNMNGLDVARRLRADGVGTRIIFLTVHDDPDYLSEAMTLGAMAYVIKDRLVSDLPQAIHDVSAGRRFVSASPKLQRSGSEGTP
ncbi:MAG: response regulator transcription factor [Nitrospiraceae bacterium]